MTSQVASGAPRTEQAVEAGPAQVYVPGLDALEPDVHAYGRIVATEAAALSAQLGSAPDEQET